MSGFLVCEIGSREVESFAKVAKRNSTEMFPTKIDGRDEFAASHWLGGEVGNCDVRDKRLDKRFKRLAADLAGSIGDTIPMACQDWANTKALIDFSPTRR